MINFLFDALFYIQGVAQRAPPWILLTCALAIAAIVGILSVKLREKVTRWVSWPISVLLSLFALMIMLIVALGVGTAIPATDSSIFATTAKYSIAIKADRPGRDATAYDIEIAFSPDIQVDADAVLSISRISPASDPTKDLPVTASAASDLILRTPRPCPPTPTAAVAPLTSSCSLGQQGSPPLPARWMVRSSKAGVYIVTLGVSELFGATFDIASPNWYATLSKNGELIQTRIRTSTRLEWSGGEERTDITTVPVRLDTSHRQFRDGSVEFDLSGQQIDIGVSAKTTLGVSAAVYQSISITATAISAALGGGWIWQIITFLRNRQKQPLRHIPLGKRLRDRDR